MERDPKMLFDKPSNAPSCPQFGTEAEGLGTVAKPVQYLSGLFGVQVRGATGPRLGRQCGDTALAIGPDPAPHGSLGDAEKVGDLDLGIAGVDALHCQAPAFL